MRSKQFIYIPTPFRPAERFKMIRLGPIQIVRFPHKFFEDVIVRPEFDSDIEFYGIGIWYIYIGILLGRVYK